MLRVDTSSLFIIPRKCNNTDVERGHKKFVLLHFLGMMNKLLVSTLNICIVTFPWDGEQTACVHSQHLYCFCVHSQHLYCYISLGAVCSTSQGNVTIQMLGVDTNSLFIIPRKCNNTDVERGHTQFVHHPKVM
jgi:hypothetical protein